MRHGSHDDPVKPKGVPKKKKMKVDRVPIRGDKVATTEQAIWLNPRYRSETNKEIRNRLT